MCKHLIFLRFKKLYLLSQLSNDNPLIFFFFFNIFSIVCLVDNTRVFQRMNEFLNRIINLLFWCICVQQVFKVKVFAHLIRTTHHWLVLDLANAVIEFLENGFSLFLHDHHFTGESLQFKFLFCRHNLLFVHERLQVIDFLGFLLVLTDLFIKFLFHVGERNFVLLTLSDVSLALLFLGNKHHLQGFNFFEHLEIFGVEVFVFNIIKFRLFGS